MYGLFKKKKNQIRFYNPLRCGRQVRTAYNDNNNNNIVYRTVGTPIQLVLADNQKKKTLST